MSANFTDKLPECPACDGPGAYLGTLGRLDWWACRGCGLQFDTPADDRRRRRRRPSDAGEPPGGKPADTEDK